MLALIIGKTGISVMLTKNITIFWKENDETGKIDTFYNQAVDETKYGFKS